MKQPTVKPAPRTDLYETTRDYDVTVDGERVVVPKGLRFDGASIPEAAWQLTYTPFHPDVMAAAVVHDWLYYNHQVERETADGIFFDLVPHTNVCTIQPQQVGRAVGRGCGCARAS